MNPEGVGPGGRYVPAIRATFGTVVLTGGVAPAPKHVDLYGNTTPGERVERGRQWV